MQALVWSVATYGCESWTLRKNEETRLDAFEIKGLRKIMPILYQNKLNCPIFRLIMYIFIVVKAYNN